MKLRQTLSIVVLFVTGLNICLSQNSSTAASTSAVNNSSTSMATSTNATTATSTATSTTKPTTTMSQTTTPMNHTCYNSTCSFEGCLKNVNSTCFGTFCKFETQKTSNGTVTKFTASCEETCTPKNCTDASSLVRTCCCQSDRCNNDYQTNAPPPASGTSISPTLFLMLSIFLFIVVKKEL